MSIGIVILKDVVIIYTKLNALNKKFVIITTEFIKNFKVSIVVESGLSFTINIKKILYIKNKCWQTIHVIREIKSRDIISI